VTAQQEIITQLQKEILPLQGFRPPSTGAVALGLGEMERAFPNGCFPVSGLHEFICDTPEGAAASNGFISALLTPLMQSGGVALGISTSRKLFPPALKRFGLVPDRVIFIDLKKEQEVLWAMEESLKCEGLAAVVGDIKELDFTASRRFQLAIEKSRVTAFVTRYSPRRLNTIASIARWRITPAASIIEDGMPGTGCPLWNIELLKVRNGRPGTWQLGWSGGHFVSITGDVAPVLQLPGKMRVYA